MYPFVIITAIATDRTLKMFEIIQNYMQKTSLRPWVSQPI